MDLAPRVRPVGVDIAPPPVTCPRLQTRRNVQIVVHFARPCMGAVTGHQAARTRGSHLGPNRAPFGSQAKPGRGSGGGIPPHRTVSLVVDLTLAAWALLELGVRVRESVQGKGGRHRDRGTRILVAVAL